MQNQIKHFLRYGTHAEKNFFLGSFKDDYDAVIINGNMLANSENAISAFIFKLQKPFLIDPQTHAFQHNPKYIMNGNGEIKNSIKKLADNFGILMSSAIERGEAVQPSDLADMDDFVSAVIKFERNKIKDKVLESEDNEYITFALQGQTLNAASLVPVGIIAPYFYMDSTNIDGWLPINLKLVDKTKELVDSNTMVYAEVVISKDVLNNESLLKRIIESYSESHCDKILVWVDSFAEEEQNTSSLINFVNLVKGFRQGGKEVYNLYGGYFSILLTSKQDGLNGVSHGLDYGEYRGVIPVGGGVPLVKYYFPPFHTRIRIEELATILSKKGWQSGGKNMEFSSLVCGCPKCTNIEQFEETLPPREVGRGIRKAFPTTAAKRHSLEHYLYCKKAEFDSIGQRTLAELVDDMKKTKIFYEAVVEDKVISHLDNWSCVISQQ